MAMRHTCDVAVIGAGLSGLYTARLLAAAGADVLVVEAQSRVGGRTLTVHFGDGTFVDDGGQWVSPGQPCIVRLADELGIQLRAHHEGPRRRAAEPSDEFPPSKAHLAPPCARAE